MEAKRFYRQLGPTVGSLKEMNGRMGRAIGEFLARCQQKRGAILDEPESSFIIQRPVG